MTAELIHFEHMQAGADEYILLGYLAKSISVYRWIYDVFQCYINSVNTPEHMQTGADECILTKLYRCLPMDL